MKKVAFDIAVRFFTFREGVAPENLTLTETSPYGNRFTFRTTFYKESVKDDVTYEIEIDPSKNIITMKEVLAEYELGGFVKERCHISELNTNDLFRLEGNIVLYRYVGICERYGAKIYCFTRADGRTVDSSSEDIMVYPSK